MIEIAFGILLALAILLCVPFLMRGLAALIPIAALSFFALFFLGTGFGRSLIPVVFTLGMFFALIAGAGRLWDWREAKKRGPRQVLSTAADDRWHAR
ncbi:hypothetical protein ASC80_05490 [Afipia sp. Root123D2]|uniref:hypothetical protein n=1 Tax=Afipia sp. Root123D2 TaxID=1736436 RepID=UPI0006F24C4A|nr:hypothetical protein [Afipia sp. Root123D2]KQW22794.1 hypothetical protein ASC80_05490 [Afipia sp. Root123D2]